VHRFVDTAHQEATRILTENMDDLHRMANALLEYETLTGEEIKAILRGEMLDRPVDAPEPAAQPSRPQTVPTAGKGRRPGASPEPQPGT
jgi:cell division protease FtsH